ncbi:hypothetical protein E1B28_013063 [Marasmius oreades]|uniref:Uncharacterized protein n=1 Tax=Marasmius oreades TaxID=181124 RepID=A0A9P7RPV1_9AGAR|nr:uncharacterized protein E1B28_013063 [Marasmius oreades]KAG7087081.1 hypothetical protein E1B28_013063 [Marasmius oreades]
MASFSTKNPEPLISSPKYVNTPNRDPSPEVDDVEMNYDRMEVMNVLDEESGSGNDGHDSDNSNNSDASGLNMDCNDGFGLDSDSEEEVSSMENPWQQGMSASERLEEVSSRNFAEIGHDFGIYDMNNIRAFNYKVQTALGTNDFEKLFPSWVTFRHFNACRREQHFSRESPLSHIIAASTLVVCMQDTSPTTRIVLIVTSSVTITEGGLGIPFTTSPSFPNLQYCTQTRRWFRRWNIVGHIPTDREIWRITWTGHTISSYGGKKLSSMVRSCHIHSLIKLRTLHWHCQLTVFVHSSGENSHAGRSSFSISTFPQPYDSPSPTLSVWASSLVPTLQRTWIHILYPSLKNCCGLQKAFLPMMCCVGVNSYFAHT